MSTAPLSKRYQIVEGKRIAFHERGDGDAIVFLHGNPTSSYLWRNVVPHVANEGRCIVPDLIGHGDSDKLDDAGPGSYGFLEHRRYLDGFLEQIELGERVTLVLRPTLSWPRQLPIDGEPAEVVEIVERNAEWMSQVDIPKLFINSDLGVNITGRTRDFCRTWPAQTEVTVPGVHYLQEDNPDLIGAALSEWLTSVNGGTQAEGVLRCVSIRMRAKGSETIRSAANGQGHDVAANRAPDLGARGDGQSQRNPWGLRSVASADHSNGWVSHQHPELRQALAATSRGRASPPRDHDIA